MIKRQTRIVDPSNVREILNYDPVTGIFTWKARQPDCFKNPSWAKRWNTRYVGKRAGSIWTDKKSGYQNREIHLFGKKYREHYLAWIYMTGKIPAKEIDHKNRDSLDNRWRNLKESTHVSNCNNRPQRIDNTTGVTGVKRSKNKKRWEASCTHEGKSYYLGSYPEIDEAAMAVLEFRASNEIPLTHGIGLANRYIA